MIPAIAPTRGGRSSRISANHLHKQETEARSILFGLDKTDVTAPFNTRDLYP